MKFETSNLCMNPKYRPCIVKGKKALFHRWAEVRKIIPPSPMIGGHGGGVVADVFWIVEYDDGSVECLLPECIRFSDRLFQAYFLAREPSAFCPNCSAMMDLENEK